MRYILTIMPSKALLVYRYYLCINNNNRILDTSQDGL